VVHDEKREDVTLALALSALEPPWPQAFGVLRAVEKPTLEVLAREQEKAAAAMKGPKDLAALLQSGDTWEVGAGEA
jgi:2-oxoglutarate ferredoxin oxidoreductase subunit beta